MTLALTDAQIRQYLDDLGLPQVDPAQFRASTLPELLLASVDFGRIRPVLRETSCVSVNYSTAIAVGLFLNLVAPAANQIIHAVKMSIRFTNANIETINVQKTCGATIRELWTDFAGDPGAKFKAEPYIGNDTSPSQSWGALGLDDIVVFGSNPDSNNVGQILQLNLVSIAALVKTAVITFDADIYEWEDWKPYH